MAIYKKQNSGYLPFVQKTEVTSPFTDIQNRAKVDDSLKTSFGVERLHVNSLELKSKEFGPNGESVYGPDSGDNRIRFVGDWSSQFNAVGLFSITTTQGDYVEVTAYCTGLNMLIYESPTARQYDFYVDGVLDQAGVSINNSDVLNSRNYKTNLIKNVKSGLSLGWHTFRIELSSANDFLLYGFEIVNESADMTVKAGKAHGNGNEYIVENDLTVSYNTGFDNVADIDVSSKGGRVAVYVDPQDGQVKKRLTNVPEDVLSGIELVTNGTFDTDISGWTNNGGASWNVGKLRIDGSIATRSADQAISTIAGKTYKVTFDYDNITNAAGAGAIVAAYTGANATGDFLGQRGTFGTGVGSIFFYFTATSTTSYIYLSVGDNVDLAEFDNISVQELTQGRGYLSGTDHSSEAIYRKINFREFGRNRADDFSTLAGTASNRAFTLDDGTTTLVGNLVQYDSDAGKTEGLRPESVGSFVVLTFVGTGLDLTIDTNAGTTYEYFVDGVSIGQEVTSLTSGKINKKICSGLSYGTHTVKWATVGTPSGGTSFIDAIIYQPKKPSLPKGVIELADYNLMADFQFNNTVVDAYAPSLGVLSKNAMRESVYIDGSGGTISWVQNGGIAFSYPSGFDLLTDRTGSFEITFYGTGLVYNFFSTTNRSSNISVTINGSDLTSANFPTATFNTKGAGISFNDSTGVLDGQSSVQQEGSAFSVSGLPLGAYTIKFQNNNAGQYLQGGVLDIITPIHSPHTTFGSLSMKDVRNFDSAKDVNNEVREKIAFASVNDSPTEIFKSKGISQVLNTGTGFYNIYLENPTIGVKTVIGSCTRGGKIFASVEGQKQNDKERVQIESTAGAENNPFDISIKGKLQKDEFEE